MLLVGSDAVEFNRAFAAAGLSEIVRLSPLMEENMLLASGAEATAGLYAAARFFETLPSAAGLDFSGRYSARFGVRAPVLNSPGESCCEGLTLLSHLVARAKRLDVPAMAAAAPGLVYDSPRGHGGDDGQPPAAAGLPGPRRRADVRRPRRAGPLTVTS